ncbi:ParA family protein [Sulfuriflexus sp.]|uniref:ParA family protein n=1 Tax=Sulfuriflexus sp. TaxID=2015443 RepID=UPI0028CDB6DF|nr:ParA family protein [Sulfuriflexus sp.]MDT8403906.1 ParA family protein [Sulfuriflexus sp.]
MKIWAIANQKGGVGKTTTAVTLAGLLAQAGYRTLLMDADPHGSMSVYLGHDPDVMQGGLYQLFHEIDNLSTASVRDILLHSEYENIDLMPASSSMAALDRQMGTRGGMGLVFSKALQLIKEDYDFVLIDCPPLLGILMVNALAVCDELLVPVQTEFLALKGLERIVHTLNMIMQSRNEVLHYTVIPTLYDRRTRASRGALEALQEQYPETLWPGVIPVDTQFREASRVGAPLSMMSPQTRGAQAYSNLLEYLLSADQQAAANS